ncbi:unnamed protein product [Peronospora destructor]|uniref:Uncharacterized protein n=1 Tax=Peronospora destructor TaxID=86335 RepID=A0AAV0TNA1_9STRA|nr:unnamed protein product [Peronospora destructor]
MSWITIQSGIVWFSPKRDMATQSMAKRRHFGSFCLAIIYNFPSLVYRAIEPGELIAYSAKVHRHHDCILNRDGTSLSHFDTGMKCGVTPVTSMSACDTTASMASGTTVHFGVHPTLARVGTYGLAIEDGDRKDENSSRLSPDGAAMKRNEFSMIVRRRLTSK